MDSALTPVMKSFVAGSLSGTCSTLLFQPLDLVKTRIQSPVALGRHSTGMIATTMTVLRNEKLVGLWKGVVPSISRCVPGVGLYFASLDSLKRATGISNPSPAQALLLGASARTFSGVVMLPFTVVKTRYESGYFNYKGVGQALASIYKTEGGRALFSGLAATLLRDAPFSGLYLMFYTQSKRLVADELGREAVPAVNFGCGVASGLLASTLTQPADVVKTHMQLYPKKYRSCVSVIRHVLKTEGPGGLWSGVAPRCLRRTLIAALAWTIYEQVTASLNLK